MELSSVAYLAHTTPHLAVSNAPPRGPAASRVSKSLALPHHIKTEDVSGECLMAAIYVWTCQHRNPEEHVDVPLPKINRNTPL